MIAHRRRRRRRRHHEAVVILIGGAVLLAADAFAWLLYVAWHLMPVLLPLAVLVVGCRRFGWHRRALGWLARRRVARPAAVVSEAPKLALTPTTVITPDPLDQAELRKLRDDNAKLRTKVRVLSDMVNGPEVRP